MINPDLLNFAKQIVAFLLAGGLVFLATWAMRLRPGSWKIERPGKSALVALVVAVAILAAYAAYFYIRKGDKPPSSTVLPVDLRFTAGKTMKRVFLDGLFIVAPVLIVIRIRREPWSSTGFSSHNLWRSLAISLPLCVMVLFSSGPSVIDTLQNLSIGHIWALGRASTIGFGEEFLFRGFMQIRMMSWLGRWKGWVVTSLVMALTHITPLLLEQGMGPLDALVSAAMLIPVSLFLGFVMLRTGNVVAPGLLHAVAGWVNFLR